ncbi:MAG: RDD family protein [Pseudomonadota bacterium]
MSTEDWPNFEDYSYESLLDVYAHIDGRQYPARKARIAELIKEKEAQAGGAQQALAQSQQQEFEQRRDSSDSGVVIHPRYDTFWRRFWAGMIDGLVLIGLAFILDRAVLLLPESTWQVIGNLRLFEVFAYTVFLHAAYGQTVGKFIVDVKVLTCEDESEISLKQAWLRDSVPFILTLIGVLIMPGWQVQMDQGGVSSLPVLFQFLLSISLIWTVLEILTMLSNDKRRALHDYIAGTVVVKVDVPAIHEPDMDEEK